MSVVLPTPEAAVVARFVAGDESALVARYRQQKDSLLSAAAETLGPELAHFRSRVAHQAMLDTWHARERFPNPSRSVRISRKRSTGNRTTSACGTRPCGTVRADSRSIASRSPPPTRR